jgi:hypothetical protein
MFKVNEIVRVVKCECCAGVVGKTGRIKSLSENGDSVSISFGKGRPQRGRPELFPTGDLALVTAEVEVNNG